MKLEIRRLGDLLRMLSYTTLTEILDDSSLHPQLDEIKREEPNDVLQQTERNKQTKRR